MVGASLQHATAKILHFRFDASVNRHSATSSRRPENEIYLADIVAASGRLSINGKGTGTCPDDPVFRHRELTGLCLP
jgi:hypothetical protein